MRFEGKKVLITGATSGIGRATSIAFAKEGADVYVVGRNQNRGNKVVADIKELGRNGMFLQCDVSSPEEVEKIYEMMSNEGIIIDVLVNNAGVFITQSLDDMVFDDWSTTFSTNVNSVMLMTKAFINDLKKSRGCIINNASISGLDIFTSGTKNYMYGASKSAVVKFSKLCALNYAPDVRVNVVCPGIVDTELFTNRDFSRFDGVIPMGYISKPEQIAKLIMFLASEDADYITGAVIPVDGGMSLK